MKRSSPPTKHSNSRNRSRLKPSTTAAAAPSGHSLREDYGDPEDLYEDGDYDDLNEAWDEWEEGWYALGKAYNADYKNKVCNDCTLYFLPHKNESEKHFEEGRKITP